MYKTLSAPLVVQIEATYRCPCSCSHCYNFWRDKVGVAERTFPDLSMSQMNRVVEQLIKYKVFHVIMTGGEPLMNKRVVFGGIEKLRQAGITVGINSTLIPLKLSDAKFLKQVGVSGVLTSILGPDEISHDAITQKSGSFKRTILGVRILQEVGVRVVANMVVSQANLHLLEPTALLVKSLGLKSFCSTRAACPANCTDFSGLALSLDEFRTYLGRLYKIGVKQNLKVDVLESYPLCGMKEITEWPELMGRRCLAGVTGLTVGSDGFVRPCSHLDTRYGDLNTEGLGVIWSRMKGWRTGEFLPKTCQNCKLLVRCGGGCRMEAKMMSGSIMQMDPYTSPSDVPYILSQVRLQKKSVQTDTTMTSFRLNRRIRWRDENFGSIVFLGQRSTCYLNKSSTEFLNGLDLNQVYRVEDIVSKYGKEARSFLFDLRDKNVIISVES